MPDRPAIPDFDVTFRIPQELVDEWAVLGGADGRIHIDVAWARERFDDTVIAGLQVAAHVVEAVGPQLEEHGLPSRVTAMQTKFVNFNHPSEDITARVHVAEVVAGEDGSPGEVRIEYETSTARHRPTIVGSATLRR